VFQKYSLYTSITNITGVTNIIVIPKQQEERHSEPPRIPKKSRMVWRVGELLLVLIILVLSGLAHGIGMFNNPFFLGDEGIYMSQAWAVLKEGRFDPYTYTYGHAPVGWVQIAIWLFLVGGTHTFGTAIDTGRVLMLLFQIGSTFLLYRIARTISRNVLIATLTCLLFALSPYAISMHRRVLLDNIMTFWMLLSLLLLLSKRLSLNHIWISAVALAIAVLSKENAILLTPVLSYLVYYRSHPSHRWFATIGWLAVVTSIISMYVLMAALKGELFPTGTLLGGNNDHVSLLGSVTWQAARDHDGGLFDLHSQFWNTMHTWSSAEPTLVIGGMVFAFLSILLIKRHRLVGLMGLATLSLWLFLVRGSLVLDFYLSPELPFMALNITLVMGALADDIRSGVPNFKRVGHRRIFFANLASAMIHILLIVSCVVGMKQAYSSPVLGLAHDPQALWKSSETTETQRETLRWIQKHISHCSSLIIDPAMWTDLHDPPTGNGFKMAHNYWQVQLDPAIKNHVFHDDWRNVDYIVATPGLLFDVYHYQLKLVQDALNHSTQIQSFQAPDWKDWRISIYQVRRGVTPGKHSSLSAPSGHSGHCRTRLPHSQHHPGVASRR
jgi:4-amino-4-deoxy-L-arabinose transferase-like glycosyltransferase